MNPEQEHRAEAPKKKFSKNILIFFVVILVLGTLAFVRLSLNSDKEQTTSTAQERKQAISTQIKQNEYDPNKQNQGQTLVTPTQETTSPASGNYYQQNRSYYPARSQGEVQADQAKQRRQEEIRNARSSKIFFEIPSQKNSNSSRSEDVNNYYNNSRGYIELVDSN